MSQDHDLFIPPDSVAHNAKKGLELRKKFGYGGTRIGIGRAYQLSKQETLSPSTIKRMASYFARHSVDKKAEHFADKDKPSKGYIAWLLWGGDEGQKWSEKIKEKLEVKRK